MASTGWAIGYTLVAPQSNQVVTRLITHYHLGNYRYTKSMFWAEVRIVPEADIRPVRKP